MVVIASRQAPGQPTQPNAQPGNNQQQGGSQQQQGGNQQQQPNNTKQDNNNKQDNKQGNNTPTPGNNPTPVNQHPNNQNTQGNSPGNPNPTPNDNKDKEGNKGLKTATKDDKPTPTPTAVVSGLPGTPVFLTTFDPNFPTGVSHRPLNNGGRGYVVIKDHRLADNMALFAICLAAFFAFFFAFLKINAWSERRAQKTAVDNMINDETRWADKVAAQPLRQPLYPHQHQRLHPPSSPNSAYATPSPASTRYAPVPADSPPIGVGGFRHPRQPVPPYRPRRSP
ncbi:hypothetical protein CspHIS471_0602660 [Cutaneotrichosporon sp. HIS471]|nr:hypothetical protein CspHIS471_0602660 [Cutaneotrichosporon sp. HIS471]